MHTHTRAHAHVAAHVRCLKLHCPRFTKSLHWEWRHGVVSGVHLRNCIRTRSASTSQNSFPCHLGKINQFPKSFVAALNSRGEHNAVSRPSRFKLRRNCSIDISLASSCSRSSIPRDNDDNDCGWQLIRGIYASRQRFPRGAHRVKIERVPWEIRSRCSWIFRSILEILNCLSIFRSRSRKIRIQDWSLMKASAFFCRWSSGIFEILLLISAWEIYVFEIDFKIMR